MGRSKSNANKIYSVGLPFVSKVDVRGSKVTEADLPKHCIKQLDVWCPEDNAEEDGSIKSEESTSASNADDGKCR